MLIWEINYEMSTMDPMDGRGPITYWWEDMRPSEVFQLIQETYVRGYEYAKHCAATMEQDAHEALLLCRRTVEAIQAHRECDQQPLAASAWVQRRTRLDMEQALAAAVAALKDLP